jgi:uncharacterized protein
MEPCTLMAPPPPSTTNPGKSPTATSPNKELVRGYYESKGTEYSRLLADDVVLTDWDIGAPVSGAVTRGKAAYVQNRGNREFKSEIVRMTEEGKVVVVEGFARGSKKDGGTWTVRFCDIYEIEDGKFKRVSTHGVDLKESA